MVIVCPDIREILFWLKENGADAAAEAVKVADKVEQLLASAAEQTVMVAVPGTVPPVKAITLPLLIKLAATVLVPLLPETT